MAQFERSDYRFHTEARPDEPLGVLSFHGSEAIARPFRFELDLVSRAHDLPLDDILKAPCRLELKRRVTPAGGGSACESLFVHGRIADLGQLDRLHRDWTRCRAVLVPRLWKLGLGSRSRIFMDLTVPEIVARVLGDGGLDDADFEFKPLARDYPKKEYVVQYREPDLDFLHRLCEHEGLFYFFEQGEKRERILFADSGDPHRTVRSEGPIRYRPAFAAAGGPDRGPHEETIPEFACWKQIVPSEVIVKDYNWHIPEVDLRAQASVGGGPTVGDSYEYGDHYRDPDEGKVYARIRAEELQVGQTRFDGSGNVVTFRAGATFELRDHDRSDFNTRYLITEVTHEGSQEAEGLDLPGTAYRNRFRAIPASVPFRPARTTPKPRIHGALSAIVDAAGEGEYAEIDSHGRYKVRVPFDLSDKSGGQASWFVRMAQPYAGSGMGMHFPLHKGTEVIVVHVNGDPDRPVIAGAVPNAATPSPVTGENQTQCVIQTSGGNRIQIENAKGNQKIRLYSPHKNTGIEIGAP
ncbi:MAG: type VI secretion system tip protein VgrG [Planctomycetes bacterium]|nr:type VI secretion system tip protein VgrG [Planctomycetota bacterium]